MLAFVNRSTTATGATWCKYVPSYDSNLQRAGVHCYLIRIWLKTRTCHYILGLAFDLCSCLYARQVRGAVRKDE